MMPQKLIEIREFLIKQSINLTQTFDDGRINSSINESEILNIIYSHYEIDIPKYRSWFDFSFTEEGVFIPVNIKITETTRADNLNAKLGMYYALTGLLPDFPNEINWLNYFEILSDNMGKNKKRDYYFLVVNKNNTNDVFINSLKCLRKLVPNGNNIPFQCRWIDNKNPIQRKVNSSHKCNFLMVQI